jgi:hypothetical protein
MAFICIVFFVPYILNCTLDFSWVYGTYKGVD